MSLINVDFEITINELKEARKAGLHLQDLLIDRILNSAHLKLTSQLSKPTVLKYRLESVDYVAN